MKRILREPMSLVMKSWVDERRVLDVHTCYVPWVHRVARCIDTMHGDRASGCLLSTGCHISANRSFFRLAYKRGMPDNWPAIEAIVLWDRDVLSSIWMYLYGNRIQIEFVSILRKFTTLFSLSLKRKNLRYVNAHIYTNMCVKI